MSKTSTTAKSGGVGHRMGASSSTVDSSAQSTTDEPRQLSIAVNNIAVAWTPFPVTVIKPYAPFYTVRRSEPFQPKAMWKGAIQGIKALKRMKLNIGDSKKLRSEMLVVTGHTLGHLMLVNADNLTVLNKATHYNNVTVADLVVTNTLIHTLVEKDAKTGSGTDDSDVYVWDMNTFQPVCQLSAHEERVCCLTVDEEDEYHVMTGGIDKVIYVWDVKAPTQPKHKLVGHQMAVTKLAHYRKLLVSGSADSTVRMWDLNSQTCLAAFEGHQGSISYLQWSELPRPGRIHADGTKTDPNPGFIISACASGIIRYYRVDAYHMPPPPGEKPQTQATMTLLWGNKAHKAIITDVCWDGELIISASAADGLNFYTANTKHNTKVGSTDGGIRQLAVDTTRKLVVAGSDYGQLLFFSYSGLVNPSAADSEGLALFAALQPHTGSISSIVLERAGNGQWERLITASNDTSIFVLDFDVDRDSKSFAGQGNGVFAEIAPTGTAITASDNQITLWDTAEMVKKADAKTIRTLSGHTKRINCVRYSAEHHRIVTGADDGFLRTWDVSFYGDDAPERRRDETVHSGDVVDLGMAVRVLSHTAGPYVAAGLQRLATATNAPTSKAGALAVVNFVKGTQIGSATPTFVFAVALRLHSYVHPETGAPSFALVAQLRNGEVLLLQGTEDGYQVLRSIVREQVSYSLERDADASLSLGSTYNITAPLPVPIRTAFFVRASVARVEYLSVEERTLRCVEITTLPADNSNTTIFSYTFDSIINDVKAVAQGPLHCAVATEDGFASVLSHKGQPLFIIGYEGTTHDIQADTVRAPKRRQSFVQLRQDGTPLHRGTGEGQPGCSAVAVSSGSRVVVLGYRDGVIQMWDISHRKVCRRIHAHSASITKCWILPQSLRLASASVAGTLRFDILYSRNVRDAPEAALTHATE